MHAERDDVITAIDQDVLDRLEVISSDYLEKLQLSDIRGGTRKTRICKCIDGF